MFFNAQNYSVQYLQPYPIPYFTLNPLANYPIYNGCQHQNQNIHKQVLVKPQPFDSSYLHSQQINHSHQVSAVPDSGKQDENSHQNLLKTELIISNNRFDKKLQNKEVFFLKCYRKESEPLEDFQYKIQKAQLEQKTQLQDPTVASNSSNNNQSQTLENQLFKTRQIIYADLLNQKNRPQFAKIAIEQRQGEEEEEEPQKSKESAAEKKLNTNMISFHFTDEDGKIIQISNIVKNILQAFYRFLKEFERLQGCEESLVIDNEKLQKCIQKILQIKKRRNCNNLVIKDLLKNELTEQIFKYFLQRKAASWIDNSKIQHKDTYRKVLAVYLQIAQQPVQSDKSYTKKRSKRQRY